MQKPNQPNNIINANFGGNNNAQIDPELVAKNAKDVKCDNCDSSIFEEALRIKRVSGIAIAQPQDLVIPIPTLVCKICGAVLELD